MLFLTSGRAPTVRRSRSDLGPWFSGAPSADPDDAVKDAAAALRHAGDDIAEAARQVTAEASRQIRANATVAGDDLAEATRQISADASRQVRRNAAAARKEAERQIRRNAGAARKEAERQIRRNAAAVRANASALPDELLPVGRDAIRTSVEKLVPSRRNRARRGPLFGVLAVLAGTGLALLGVQMLMARRSALSMRPKTWARGTEEPVTGDGGMTALAATLGMAGTTRPAASGTPMTGRTAGTATLSTAATTGLASTFASSPSGTSAKTGSDGQRPPAELPPDAATEPSTFDRDAGIRAATEGMEPPEPLAPGSLPSEIADGT